MDVVRNTTTRLALLFTLAVLLSATLSGGVADGGTVERMLLLDLERTSEGAIALEQQAVGGSLQVRDGRVLVVLETESDRGVHEADLAALGAQTEGYWNGLLQAWLPVNRLEAAAALPGVAYIRRPHAALSLQEPRLVSEGVVVLGASLFHGQGVLGGGVKVGVIDLGFSSLTQAHRVGEFTVDAVRWARDYTGNGLESESVHHGTGVAQIVHNMAPEAELYLAKIRTEVQLASAVRDLVHERVDIIVHAAGWTNTNFGDGTGVIADIANTAVEAGILWVNAAGNHAKRHWIGTASDVDEEGWVAFAPGLYELSVRVDLPGEILVALTWDEWPQATTDLDLYLLDVDGQELARSVNRQDGREPPAEFLRYFAEPGRYGVRVRRVRGQEPVNMEIFSLAHELTPHVPEMSLLTPADVDGVKSVGAIGLASWPAGPQQPYSSQGPTNDGRLKPDIMGLDGVTNFAYHQFFGTSAAAPHVAGAAALLLSQARRSGTSYGAQELAEQLRRWAVDMGEPGPDSIYGHGRLHVHYEPPSGTRRIASGSDVPLQPGGTVSVDVKVKLPATQMGGLRFVEALPQGTQASQVRAGEGVVRVSADRRRIEVVWHALPHGSVRQVAYELVLSEDIAPGTLEIEGTVNGELIGGDATLEVAAQRPPPQEARVVAFPNPARDGEVSFTVEPRDTWELRLWIYDLSGRLVFESDWQPGPSYQWHLQDERGRIVAGGVYLYWVEIRAHDGQTVRTKIERLLVLR